MTNGVSIPSVQSGSYPVRDGNLVRPLVDGESAFRRICEAIESAKTSVWVTVTFMLVDDVWATIGSCNLHRYSLFGSSEMNATFWSPEVVRSLRCELFQEHLEQDTADLDDRAALRSFREVALENRRRFDAGKHDWQGLAFALDPSLYGR